MSISRILIASLLAFAAGQLLAASAQNCESDLSEYSIKDRESAVVQIRTRGDPSGVHGTATLIHPDGIFITAAHTIIDYDPSRLELTTIMGSQPEYSSGFEPSLIVYPSMGACANFQDKRKRCNYRAGEAVLAKRLGAEFDQISRELDFAILSATTKPPSAMVPVPIRGGAFAKDHIKFWGIPAEAKLGPTSQIEIIQNTADYIGENQGFPLYRPNYANPGLSGSLMVDGMGRGFGVTRRRKAVSSSIEVETGSDVLSVDDANQLFAVPISIFFEAGLLDEYKTSVMQRFVNSLRNPPINSLTGEPFTINQITNLYSSREWSLLDSFGITDLLVAHIDFVERQDFLKALAAMTVVVSAQNGSCISENLLEEDLSILIAEAVSMDAITASTNSQPYETRVALFGLAEATDWGDSLSGPYGGAFASEVSETFASSFDIDALSSEQRSRLAYMAFKADVATPANGGIYSPIEYAVQLDAAPYILDQYAIRSDRERNDIVSAFTALLAAQGKLEQKYDLADTVPKEVSGFRAVTDANVEFFKNRLLAQGALPADLTAKLREGSIAPTDLYEFTDAALVEALSAIAPDD